MPGNERFEFPEALSFLLFESCRYKCLHGGRGGGKTENIARALIIFSRAKKLRIACFRDLQKSIRESTHQTISLCISEMGLDAEFDVQQYSIVHKITGSEFIFFGLRYNINSLKSLARIDIAWVDEAETVTNNAWTKLGPTIRGRFKDSPTGRGGPFGNGPEIWVSFNPELDTDDTYQRFVVKKNKLMPETIIDEETGKAIKYAIVKQVSYKDNKWFPSDLRFEMEVLKASDEAEYLHVWEGHTKVVLDGAIYADEIKQVLKDGRRGHVPYDPSRPVLTFWDLGHDDYTSITFAQQVGIEYNIIDYEQDRLKKISHYIELLQEKKYNYGFHYLPHDGDNETLTGRSPKKILLGHYPGKVRMTPRVAHKVNGIRAAREVFPLVNFDEEHTSELWQCLIRYQYKVDDETGVFSREPLHNEYSHGADSFQTFAQNCKSETAMKKKQPKTVTPSFGRIPRSSSAGWMG